MGYRSLLAQRRLEWWLASYTVLWGGCLIVIPNALDSGAYVLMRIWAPAAAWGAFAGAVGMFHLWALWINGRRHWSPHVRAIATTCNAAVFTLALAAQVAAIWYELHPIGATALIHVAPVGEPLRLLGRGVGFLRRTPRPEASRCCLRSRSAPRSR